MGKRPIATSTSRRPTLESANTEEAFRVIEQRIGTLENTVEADANPDEFDDTLINNDIRYLQNAIRKLWARRITSDEAGDTYDSYFKVTHTEGNSYVNVGAGRIISKVTTNVSAFTLPITLSNGTHYVYVRVYQYQGFWYYQFIEGTSLPNSQVDDIYYSVAEFEVIDGAIDGTTIVQHSFGEIIHPPDFKELYPFAVTRTSTNLTVFVFQGRIVTGTTTSVVGFSDLAIGASSGTHYVYFEVSFDNTLMTVYTSLKERRTYPENTDLYERFVVAEVEVYGGAIISIRQRYNSDFHSTRVWD